MKSIPHPFDGVDLRRVLLGHTSLSILWKEDLYWSYAKRYLEHQLKQGVNNQGLVMAGLGPVFFMMSMCTDKGYEFDRSGYDLLPELWDAWDQYKDFLGKELHVESLPDEILPYPDDMDIKGYLDRLAAWLIDFKVPVELTRLKDVFVIVWDDDNVTMRK